MNDFADSLAAFARRTLSFEALSARIDALVAAAGGDGERLLSLVQDPRWDGVLAPDDRLAVEQRILEAEAQARAARGGAGSLSPAPPRAAPVAPRPAAALPDADDDHTRMLPPEARELGVGDVIKDGRYELVEELGQGGMGKVFKAVDRLKVELKDRQPHVAIKLLSRAFRRHEISAIALGREAKKAQSLNHPNIVRVDGIDRDAERGVMFMSMEYLSGRSLDSVIKEPGFAGMPLDRALQYIRPAAAALACAHENGIVHSDFKPSNVFVTDVGKVKVIDFGIARAVKLPAAGEADQTVFDPSALGALTLPYASPEQIAGLEPDRRDDVYALACVTYELLTGRHPFDRMSSAKARAQNLQPARPANLDKQRWAALCRGLALEREQRVPSVQQFIQELEPAAAGRRKAWPVLAAGGGAAVLLVGGLAWFLARGPEPAQLPPPSAVATSEPKSAGTKAPAPPEREEVPTGKPPQEENVVVLPPAITAPPPSADEIASMLREVPCAVLHASVAQNGLVAVSGHAPGDGTVSALVEQLRTVPGVADVRTTVQPLQRFHCPPLEIAAPFVRAGADAGLGLSLAPAKPVFYGGDKLEVAITGPAFPAYVYVDYYDSGGDVLHLLPRPGAKNNRLDPSAELRLGGGGRSGDWTIQKPFGSDLFVAIGTKAPLWEGARPDVEPASTYLPILRRALDRAAAHEENEIQAAFAVVTTRAKP